MPKLSKKALLNKVVEALESDGAQIAVSVASNAHPFELDIGRDGTVTRVKVYVWNLTHGGNTRDDDEFRIQITTVKEFLPGATGETLVLGWSEEFKVFAAYDVNAHLGELGSSPSIQIDRAALLEAGTRGAAVHRKGGQEVAAAIRPDHLAAYVKHRKEVHNGDLDRVRNGDDIDFMAIASSGKAPSFGTEVELAHRKTILERLDELERAIGIAEPRPATIGHNNPPPDEAGSDLEVLSDDILDASTSIKRELSQASPDVVVVAQSAGVFQRLSKFVRSQTAKAIETLVEKAREHAVELLIGLAVSVGSRSSDILSAVNGLLNAINTWLGSLF